MKVKKFAITFVRFVLRVFWLFPIKKDKVFLMNFHGAAIGHDAKAFVTWCNENEKSLDFVWGVASGKHAKQLKCENVRMVNMRSLRGIYDIMTSKAMVFNINPPSYIPYRKQQVLVNTWHGYPFKRVGKYVTPLEEIHFNRATAFVSHSEEYTSMCIRDSLGYQGPVITCGAPRNDVFFSDRAQKNKDKIRSQYGVGNRKIALWMPTFRKNFHYEESGIDFAQLSETLKKRFGGEWVIFARLHPLLASKVVLDKNIVVDVTKHEDTQELLCAADVCLSDYSSAIWDFSLSRKPVFVYADDIESYLEDRGLYKPMSDLPFSVACNNEDLENNILSFDEKAYAERLEAYFSNIHCYECGNAAQAVYEFIFGEKSEEASQ